MTETQTCYASTPGRNWSVNLELHLLIWISMEKIMSLFLSTQLLFKVFFISESLFLFNDTHRMTFSDHYLYIKLQDYLCSIFLHSEKNTHMKNDFQILTSLLDSP